MKLFKIIILFVVLYSCNNESNKGMIDENYRSEIDSFFIAKMKERKSNYLQLVALHKLDSGSNTFGKASSNNLSITNYNLPDIIGSIKINDSVLSLNAHDNIMITTKEDSIIKNITYTLDKYGSSERLYYNQLNWQIITRSNQHYLRVWHEENPAIDAFVGFQKFKLNPNYIFDADFTYYETEKSEIVKAKVDGKRITKFIGKVSFNFNNQDYSLEVGTDGFTMVGDETTDETTYGGGRYMYINLPKENDKVVVDFNKLYNPPCSFSEFTTCLYPPRQNYLPFKISAGETITLKQQN